MADAFERRAVILQVLFVERLQRAVLHQSFQHFGVQEQAHGQPVVRFRDQQLFVRLRRGHGRLQRRRALRVGDQEVVDVVLDRRVVEVREQGLHLTDQGHAAPS